MIAFDKNALICDLAETYNIYDYKSLPVNMVATFSVGLREESRIKMKMSGAKVTTNTLILAIIADRLGNIIWSLSEDGRKGVNRPVQLLETITGKAMTKEESDIVLFDSPEDYESARKKLAERR